MHKKGPYVHLLTRWAKIKMFSAEIFTQIAEHFRPAFLYHIYCIQGITTQLIFSPSFYDYMMYSPLLFAQSFL